MNFLPVAILGYLFNGTAILVDKLLVDTSVPNPIVYTFYLSILSLVVLLLLPFGFTLPPYPALILGVLSGLSFFIAMLIFYTSLKYDEATRVAPIVGVFSPLFTLSLGILVFAQYLTQKQFLASIVLVLGLVALSSSSWFKTKLDRRHIMLMAAAGFFFSLSLLLLREVFMQTDFISGLVIARVPMAIFGLSLLIFPTSRRQIFQSRIVKHHFMNKTSLLLIMGQLSGAIGGLLITFSIFLINPAVVSAMQGVQFLFILVVVLLLSKKYQKLLDEHLGRWEIVQKAIGASVISLGLYLLTI